MIGQTFRELNPKSFLGQDVRKTTAILLLACLLPALHRYFCSPNMDNSVLIWQGDMNHTLLMFLCAFLLLGLAPAAAVHFFFKESLSDYGLTVEQWRKWLPVTIILFLIIAAAMLYPASQTQAMRSFYPFDKSATDITGFVRLQLFRGLFFYSAWEFFFRGFILFGLKDTLGDLTAICIQTIPSCLWHIGFPAAEIISSIPAGILFGILTIRSKSIFWAFLLHYLIGITLDFFIVFFH